MPSLFHRDDIEEGKSRGFEVDGRPLLAVKKNGELYLYQNRCPHLGIPLEFQPHQFLDSEGQLIQCSMHAALFKIDNGECIYGPCQGQSLSKVDFVLREGRVYLES